MSRNKKMTITFLVVALVLIAIATAAWWHLFFGTANPQLPGATVTVQSSTPGAVGGTSSNGAAAGAGAATEAVGAANPTSSAAIAAAVSQENPTLAGGRLNIDGATFSVEIASTSLEQTRGLSFRTSLGANDGMLFIFSGSSTRSFWMKDMNFPLDMIWISGDTVVGFAPYVPAPAPGTQLWQLPVYTSPAGVDKVLEVNAGMVEKYNIKIGDTVTIVPAS